MADLDINQLPRRRGRPKGTGIDDSQLLRRINDLMAADRSLKPTTAIKQCGIDNPSIVRRLREKLKTAPPPSARKKGTRQSSRQPTSARNSSIVAEAIKQTQPQAVASPTTKLPIAPQPAPTESAQKDAQKAREAALLAAYLKALQQTAIQPLDEERSAATPSTQPTRPIAPEPPPHQPRAEHASDRATTSPTPNPFARFQPPPGGMTFPFFPPFMQPFAPKPPPPNPILQNQMEALKLSVEVMTAMAKLQMFTYQNALAATPFGNMLQAQTMMGQMLLASFAGAAGLGKKPDGSK